MKLSQHVADLRERRNSVAKEMKGKLEAPRRAELVEASEVF